MKQLYIMALLLFMVPTACASSLTRLENESAEIFAKRYGPPDTALAHRVIETTQWGGKSAAIIAFYEQEFEESDQVYHRIISYIYVPKTDNAYRQVLIDTFEPEGGDPEIEAVFFFNPAVNHQNKLIIICSWPQIHYDFRGKLYATFVYEAPHPKPETSRLKFEDNISKQLYGGCECEWRDGKKTTAKYKTADEVKAALRKIGD
jgi:hypothetical protein